MGRTRVTSISIGFEIALGKDAVVCVGDSVHCKGAPPADQFAGITMAVERGKMSANQAHLLGQSSVAA